MMVIKQTWQALAIIFVGNLNFCFLLWGMSKLPFKGGAEFTVFFPYLFTVTAIKLSVYNYFAVDIKAIQNKVARTILQSVLIFATLFIAVVLQTFIYYTLARVIS